MKHNIQKINEADITKMVVEKLQEAFKSGKLSKFAKEHGGLKHGDWSNSFGNDLHNMSDEDFDDYLILDPEDHYRKHGIQQSNIPTVSGLSNQNFKPLRFGDGTFMAKQNPSMSMDDREKALSKKQSDRYERKRYDGKDTFHSVNPERDKVLNPPMHGSYKPRGKWGFPGEGELSDTQLNPRALKANSWNPETTRINHNTLNENGTIEFIEDDNQNVKELKKALHLIENVMDSFIVTPSSEFSENSPSMENRIGHAYNQTRRNLVHLINLLKSQSTYTNN